MRTHRDGQEPSGGPGSTRVDRGVRRSAPRIQAIGLRELLAAFAVESDDAGPRYEPRELIGEGAGGSVYAYDDNRLDRRIAIKILAKSAHAEPRYIRQFVSEARIIASLAHPNVVPIHDFGVSEEGQLFFTMALINGASLNDLLADSSPAALSPRIGGINGIVTIFISVCHALSFAHARGIVHQDVKPSNIMLGDHGEVLLVDWGSALRLADTAPIIYGTPWYMSPEQARCEACDTRSDVYCVGASLFHAMTLRLPTGADDESLFLDRKKRGHIDPVSAEETSRVPGALLAIALKAMAPLPGDRYPSIDHLSEDLRRYQAGLTVGAHHESVIAMLCRLHRRHARSVYPVVIVSVVAIVLALLLYGEKLKEAATWGLPALDEDFGPEWTRRWKVLEGSFVAADGAFRSTGERDSVMMLTQRFAGPVVLEFTGTIAPDARPGDLSIVWTNQDILQADAQAFGSGDWSILQVGGLDNWCASIVDPRTNVRPAVRPFRLAPGRAYRIRAQVDEVGLKLHVDGELLCEQRDLNPRGAGFVGLYACFPDKAFSDIQVYDRDPEERSSGLARGDALERHGHHLDAAEEYARFHEAHPTASVAVEARYNHGASLWRAGLTSEARQVWSGLAEGIWSDRAQCHVMEDAFAKREDVAVTGSFRELYARRSGLRWELRGLWVRFITDARVQQDQALLLAYLALRDDLFPDDATIRTVAASTLLQCDRFDEVIEAYSDTLETHQALCAVGRYEEALARYPHWLGDANCRKALGRFDELEGPFAEQSRVWSGHHESLLDGGQWALARLYGLVCAGRLQQAIAEHPRVHERAMVFRLLGRWDEALAAAGTDSREIAATWIASGRAQVSVERTPRTLPGYRHWAMCALAVDAFRRGDVAEARAWFLRSDERVFDHRWAHAWMARFIIRPFIEDDSPDRSRFRRALADSRARRMMYAQRLWYAASFVLGDLDEAAFMAQPCAGDARAILPLCAGIRAELAGETAAAIRRYASYLAVEPWLRGVEGPDRDPVVEGFAEARLVALRGSLAASGVR